MASIPVTFRLLLHNGKRGVLISTSKPIRYASTIPLKNAQSASVVSRKVVPNEGFWEKNERMQRPMSPHISIYKFELPSLMSGTHRATGFAMSAMVATVGAAALVLPGGAETYINMVKALDLPLWVLAPAKFLLIFPLCYHTVNGVRHLVWDTGRGFDMKTLYMSGYLTMGASIGAAAGIVAYCS